MVALYLEDTYLFETTACVNDSGIDEKGSYLVFDRTIFYPQGGGQPCDQGAACIQKTDIAIHFVRQVDKEIRHYVGEVDREWRGENIKLKVNSVRRLVNARYHTAAHLLSHLVETMDPCLKAVKGHSFPNEAFVEFIGGKVYELKDIQRIIDEKSSVDFTIQAFGIAPEEFEKRFYQLPYPTPQNKNFRVVQIGKFAPIPCGGTHVAKTSEVGVLTIRKVVCKGDRLKVSYEVSCD